MVAAKKKPAAKKAVRRAPVRRAVTKAVDQFANDEDMVKAASRVRRAVGQLKAEPEEKTSYFSSGAHKKGAQFISTGCAAMDEAFGGGFLLGRVSNIVGDRSSGKTLVAMEVIINFCLKFGKKEGWVRYAESESAFDQEYAAEMGVPLDRVEFNENHPMRTVEDLYDDMVRCMDKHKDKKAGLYIVDSLDALSDDKEMEADFDAATFGGAKPKAIGRLFRMLIERLADQGVHFMVISQLRDKIGVTFGETKQRSGGKALDYYCTYIGWLAEIEKLKKTVKSIERIIGVNVEVYVKKNKGGLAFRRVRYPIIYGYGIDDMTASAEWLIKHNREAMLKPLGMSKDGHKVLINKLRDEGGDTAREMRQQLGDLVRREWAIVETTFLPKSRKY